MNLHIKNRKDRDISVIVDEQTDDKGLVYFMHGLSGNKNEPLIRELSKFFVYRGYTSVRFDATNSVGESYGRYRNSTVTGFCEDLEDVIDWSRGQKWYKEPFVLVGHSVGGYCVMNYAYKNSEKLKTVIPISPIISWELSSGLYPKILLKLWEKMGTIPTGLNKRLNWSFAEDMRGHDLLSYVSDISTPVLIVSGGKDYEAPVEHQEKLYKKITSRKKFNVLTRGRHRFNNIEQIGKINSLIDSWLSEL